MICIVHGKSHSVTNKRVVIKGGIGNEEMRNRKRRNTETIVLYPFDLSWIIGTSV